MQRADSDYSAVFNGSDFAPKEESSCVSDPNSTSYVKTPENEVFVDSDSEPEEPITSFENSQVSLDSHTQRGQKSQRSIPSRDSQRTFKLTESGDQTDLLKYEMDKISKSKELAQVSNRETGQPERLLKRSKTHLLKRSSREFGANQNSNLMNLKRQNIQKIEFQNAEMSFDTWELKMAKPQHGGGISKKSGLAFALMENRNDFRAGKKFRKLSLLLRQKYRDLRVSLDEIFSEKIVSACVRLTSKLKRKFAKKKVFMRPLFIAVAYRMLKLECRQHEFLIELRDIMSFLAPRDDKRFRTKMIIYYLNQFKSFFVKENSPQVFPKPNPGMLKTTPDYYSEDSKGEDSDSEQNGFLMKTIADRDLVTLRTSRLEDESRHRGDGSNQKDSVVNRGNHPKYQPMDSDQIKIGHILCVTGTIFGTLARRTPELQDSKSRILNWARELLSFSPQLTQELVCKKPKNVGLALLFLSLTVLFPFYKVNLTDFLADISRPCEQSINNKYSGNHLMFSKNWSLKDSLFAYILFYLVHL